MFPARLRHGAGPRDPTKPVSVLPRAAAGAVRPGRGGKDAEPRGIAGARALDVAVCGGAARCGARHPRRGDDAADPRAPSRRRVGSRAAVRQRGRAEPHQFVQGAWHLGRGHSREGSGRDHDCAADGRQRRRGRRGVRGGGGPGLRDRHARRHASRHRPRIQGVRRRRPADRRADLRLRRVHRRRGAEARVVRDLDAERAVSHRGQEDDGLRAVGGDGGRAARRDRVSHRRRRRADRHVEGVRGTGGDGPHRQPAAADDRGAGRGLRAHRPRVRAACRRIGEVGGRGYRGRRSPRSQGARRLSDSRRHLRQPRRGRGRRATRR